MRKYLILAVVALVAMVVPSFAAAQEQQSLVAKVKPGTLDKKKLKPATLFVDVITEGNDEGNSDQPPSADRTQVLFSKNLKFDTTAVPNCEGTEAALQNTDTQQATDICGKKSIVSVPGATKTSAVVEIDPNPALTGDAPIVVDVVVTAFNGTAKNTIFLHSRADAVNNTSILVGKLKKASGAFGSNLDVTIPDLLAGAIADFKTTVKAGKYVQANCKDKSPNYRAITNYENHSPTTANVTGSCKRK